MTSMSSLRRGPSTQGETSSLGSLTTCTKCRSHGFVWIGEPRPIHVMCIPCGGKGVVRR